MFISYVSSDAEEAARISTFLRDRGADPWLDKERLKLGDDWEATISQAVADADVFVACLRPGFDELGFRQREIRWALQALERRPVGQGFIVPFVLKPCTLPAWCGRLHVGRDLSRPTSEEELLEAIKKHCKWVPPRKRPPTKGERVESVRISVVHDEPGQIDVLLKPNRNVSALRRAEQLSTELRDGKWQLDDTADGLVTVHKAFYVTRDNWKPTCRFSRNFEGEVERGRHPYVTVAFRLDPDVRSGKRQDKSVSGFIIDVYQEYIELWLSTSRKGTLPPFSNWSLRSDEICHGASMVARVFGMQPSERWSSPFVVLDDDGETEIYRIDADRSANHVVRRRASSRTHPKAASPQLR